MLSTTPAIEKGYVRRTTVKVPVDLEGELIARMNFVFIFSSLLF